MRQLISSEEAVRTKCQHKTPCSDCPWARTAINGWLGGLSVDEWLQRAHSDETVECHALIGAQCAGLAIYRANVAKSARNPQVLKLPRDTDKVFGYGEFRTHHEAPFKKEMP